jgi:hypothetical protein
MRGRRNQDLCFSVPSAYEDFREFAKANRSFIEKSRFVAFKKGETVDPLSDERQCVPLVSDARRPKGTRLSWEEVRCYEPPGADHIKYGDPSSKAQHCKNLRYRRNPHHIYWLKTASNLGDLLRNLGRPGHTTQDKLESYFAAMRKTNSKRLTNHNRGVVNLFHMKSF